MATVAGGAIAVGAPVQVHAKAPVFSDVEDSPAHHYFEAVMKYTARGMMSGYPDGTFRPNESITRQDAAKLLSMVLELDTKNVRDPRFKDVSQSSRIMAISWHLFRQASLLVMKTTGSDPKKV